MAPAGRDEEGLPAEDWPAEPPGAPVDPELGTGTPETEGEDEAQGVVEAEEEEPEPEPEGEVPVAVEDPEPVPVAVTVAEPVGPLEETVEDSVMVRVLVEQSWQSASPRTARHRLMGMLIRPLPESECWWQ